ncbi:MAG TPA: 1,4-dihydroxy-2-naphthoate polyprenyltransferase [Ignavibacteriaceae bacterium]|nr:1,4-dihydroxy-2-naphthoate polyprenyltransferase [Ignavibacteriaceae bacterium]
MTSKKEVPSKLQSWFLASRPKTLLASVVPVIVGSALAIGESKFILLYSVIALLCSTLIQTGTNYVNDLYDFLNGADNEDRKGPTRVLAAGYISVKEMKIGSVLIFLLAFLLGLYLVYVGGKIVLIIGVLSIIAGIAYTAGPFPLAYNGLGDIFVFLFFGIVGTAGTYYVQTQSFSLLSILASIPVGALITNILVVNNYRDIEEDRSANKHTLAVLLGKNFTRFQYIFLLLISFLTPLFLFVKFGFSYWIFLPYLTLPVAFNLVRMLFTLEGLELNKTLEISAKLSAIFGILFSIGLAL